MTIDIRQECSKAHDEALLQQLLQQSKAAMKLVALLRFNGVEVWVSQNRITTKQSPAFARVSKSRPCFIFISTNALQQEANYHRLSFQETFVAALFHEAGHIANYKKLFNFVAPASDEVEAWRSGFWMYKQFTGKSVPASFVNMAKTCLAGYGVNSNSKASVSAYKEGIIDKALQKQEKQRRAAWDKTQQEVTIAPAPTPIVKQQEQPRRGGFREWLKVVFIPKRRCSVALLNEADPYQLSSETCLSQMARSLVANFIKVIANVSVIPRSRPPPADCRTAVRLFNRSSQPKLLAHDVQRYIS